VTLRAREGLVWEFLYGLSLFYSFVNNDLLSVSELCKLGVESMYFEFRGI